MSHNRLSKWSGEPLGHEIVAIQLAHHPSEAVDIIRSVESEGALAGRLSPEDNHHILIGKESYFLSADGLLMPTRKDQPPRDLNISGKSEVTWPPTPASQCCNGDCDVRCWPASSLPMLASSAENA